MHAPAAILPRDCTFSPEDWQVLADCWHPVAYADAITDKPYGTKLLDQDLVVYRKRAYEPRVSLVAWEPLLAPN